MSPNRVDISEFKSYIKGRLEKEECLLLPNNFPYKVYAHHYVLWTRDDYSNDNECLRKFMPNVTHYKLQENPWFLKSVPSIRHVHVFVPLG